MTGESPLLAIAGPTASGKSSLAIELAKQFRGEIVNCDSSQMYRYFDIGSGKLSIEEQQGIPHHLISVLEPDERFAAGEYARRAAEIIRSIRNRGSLPIVAGGTGFYLRALLDGLFPGPTRNPELRHRLEARIAEKGREHLHRLLQRLDPVLAPKIHPNDIPKIIRALEVRLQTGRPMSEMFLEGRQGLTGFRILKLGLNPPRNELHEKINLRTKCMFETGLVKEVLEILEKGFAISAPAFQSLGYREVVDYLNGAISLEEALRLTQVRTRQYAKRQITWFRKESGVEWLSGFGSDLQIQKLAAEKVREFCSF